MIEGIFVRSFRALAGQEARGSLADVLFMGWWRICQTEPLLERAIAKAPPGPELDYWRAAYRGEAGHAEIYQRDLQNSLGEDTAAELAAAMVPCPATVALLEWADQSLVNLAVYRLWLEIALMQYPESALVELRRFLPESLELHRNLDGDHVRAGVAYLERQGGDSLAWLVDKVMVVEMALRAEALWSVFPQGLVVPPGGGEAIEVEVAA